MNQAREEKVAAAKTRMAELATKFLDRSVLELSAMRADLAKLRAGQADALDGSRDLAHRMCGTGATLGFERLGDFAAHIETLSKASAEGVLPEAATLTQLAAGIEDLATELARLDAADKRPLGS